jgi:serine/threonine protein phosphatase PrpC
MTDQYFGITDTGKERQNNEDAFIARQGVGNRFIIACVIDGVGGYAGGEIAAGIAREAILQRLEKPSGDIISMIIDCFELANERIIQQKQLNKDYAQMSCVSTLALADISNNQFYYAHVGDTRLYLLRDGSLVKISHDQSFVGFLEESGRLSEEEAMNHPKRNEINKALGFESHLGKSTDYIETGQSPFLSGDMLLLCSDGLTDMLSSTEITGILTREGSLKEKGKQLIDAANNNGGRDNVTVVLVHNDKAPQHHPATAIKQREPAVADTKSRTIEQPARDDEAELPATKSSKGIIAVLSILMLLFLASTIYLYRQNKTLNSNSLAKQSTVVAGKVVNAQQLKLQLAVSSVKGHTLTLSDTDYKTPIIISDAIRIDKDTLIIKAKGRIVFQSDSGYKGVALKLSAKCKSIVLDSLSFINFNTGVSFANNALDLKNVRFVNCKQSIQSELTFADKKYISGKLPYLAMRSDSLPFSNKK